ncbi:signal recognition particle-docking protein FtsY [Arthrobacter sp. AOP36-A1-22]|uniref:signal recognition particle-docking protein FtsY n=1 Tax=Arthrobacter sp. AOP36-A1-22 TaxID=3457684 RepID=UPI00403361DB
MPTETFLIIAIAVVVVLVVGLGSVFFLRGRKTPPGTYTGPRDANDPAPGSSGGGRSDTLTRPGQAPTQDADGGGGPGTAPAPEDSLGKRDIAVDVPAPVLGRLARLRARLVKSNNALGKGLLSLLSQDKIDEDVWDEIEETLLLADVGSEPTHELVEALRERVKVEGHRDPAQVRSMLRTELIKLVDPSMDRSIVSDRQPTGPSIVMVVGVNGVGKTTTIGKLTRVLVAEDKDVVLGAADTFRAAAAEQLATWGARVGVPTVRSHADGADPASVAFEAVKVGIEQEVDVVMIDTAGRLQNKVGLMDELGKIKRVVEKQTAVNEVLLVLDATTGQNGLNQAKVFSEVVNVTGIVLTKLDGTAKGGIVIAIQRQLGVPVKLVGLGEGSDDLAPFDAEDFVDALLD